MSRCGETECRKSDGSPEFDQHPQFPACISSHKPRPLREEEEDEEEEEEEEEDEEDEEEDTEEELSKFILANKPNNFKTGRNDSPFLFSIYETYCTCPDTR